MNPQLGNFRVFCWFDTITCKALYILHMCTEYVYLTYLLHMCAEHVYRIRVLHCVHHICTEYVYGKYVLNMCSGQVYCK